MTLGIIGNTRSHDGLHQWLSTEQPQRILDIPAGHGALAAWLQSQGWEVHCSDIDDGNFSLHESVPFSVANLNRTLPYQDEFFDAIACVNGIHRLFNPAGAIQEFARIVRPGGRLYLSVNNYASIACRLRFLLYGSVARRFDREYFCQTITEPEAFVRIPLVYSQIESYMESAGFRIVGLKSVDIGRRDKALMPAGWIIRGLSHVLRRTTSCGDVAVRNSRKEVVTGGKYVLVVGEKA